MKKFIANRVATGAVFLDVHVPGWHTRISLNTLDLTDDRDCIVGQLFGHFDDGRVKLGLRDNTPEFPDIDTHSTLRVLALDVPMVLALVIYIQLAVRFSLRRSDPISFGFFIEAWGPLSSIRNRRDYKRAWTEEIMHRRRRDQALTDLRLRQEWEISQTFDDIRRNGAQRTVDQMLDALRD